jgi:hypothetical protein
MPFEQEDDLTANVDEIGRPSDDKDFERKRLVDTKRKNTDSLLKFSPSSQLFKCIVGYHDDKR